MKFLTIIGFLFLARYAYTQCCNGAAIGGCINERCPNGTMCNNGWCCPGCYDTCSNCYQYTAYCNNPYYSCSMSCCKATCGQCHP